MSTAIALDLGSSEFRSIRQDGHRLVARKVPAVYCVLNDDLSNRRLLEQSHLPYSKTNGSLLVIGEAATTFSALLRCPVIPVMMDGHLPGDDPIGRQICSTLIEALLPVATTHHAICGLSIPAASLRQLDNQSGFLKNLISMRGYQLALLNPASALALAELSDQQFSGVNLVLGAESISVSVTHLGKAIFESSYCQGFRSLETKFAVSRHRYLWDQSGNKYLDHLSIQNWIRESGLSLTTPSSGDEFWLSKELTKLLTDAWSSMLPDLMRLNEHPALKQRMTLAVSGAPTGLSGFEEILTTVLRKSCVPFKVRNIQRTNLDPFAIARGLLVHATLLGNQPQQLDQVA